jgi:hypothetical protein
MNQEDLIELLDDGSAALDSMMGHYGYLIPAADRESYDILVERARNVCDAILRKEMIND